MFIVAGILISYLICWIVYPILPTARFILVGTALYIQNDFSVGLLIGDWTVGGVIEKGIVYLDQYLIGINPQNQVFAISIYRVWKIVLVGSLGVYLWLFRATINVPSFWIKWGSVILIIGLVLILAFVEYQVSINVIIALIICVASAWICSKSGALSPMAAIFASVFTLGELIIPSVPRKWQGNKTDIDGISLLIAAVFSSICMGIPTHSIISKEGMTEETAYNQHCLTAAFSESMSLAVAFFGIGSRDAFSTNLELLGVLDNPNIKIMICAMVVITLLLTDLKQPLTGVSNKWINVGVGTVGIFITGGHLAPILIILGVIVSYLVKEEKDAFSSMLIPCITGTLVGLN